MLSKLVVENFTVFRDATFRFSPQLNVIHGVNGTGKSHVLKLAYLIQHGLASPPTVAASSPPTKTRLQTLLAEELLEVFRPDSLGRLTTRSRGRTTARIEATFKSKPKRLAFSFHTASQTEVKIESNPKDWLSRPPVYLPTREALTLFPGFISLYDTHAIEFDRTWRDLCVLLGAPVSRGAKATQVQDLLKPLEDVMGGRLDLDRSGRFYLVDERGRIEMHLVAEGMRKLAMLARLIATGSLTDKGCLLWDEPEANLNPVVVRRVAEVLCRLAAQGVQVFVATHSLFLMRELYIVQTQTYDDMKIRYFGLHPQDGEVAVEQGETIEDSGDIASLDESLHQSERYLDLEEG